MALLEKIEDLYGPEHKNVEYNDIEELVNLFYAACQAKRVSVFGTDVIKLSDVYELIYGRESL